MRLLVINAISDRSLARLRASHPGKVFQRPLVAGKALPPRGRRVLPVDMLVPAVVDELEYLVSIGNIKVIEMGTRVPVVFDDLRERLGHPLPSSDSPTPPAESASSAVPLEVVVEESALSPVPPGLPVSDKAMKAFLGISSTGPVGGAPDRIRGQTADIIMFDEAQDIPVVAEDMPKELVDTAILGNKAALAYVRTQTPEWREEALARFEGQLGWWVENDHGKFFIGEDGMPETPAPVVEVHVGMMEVTVTPGEDGEFGTPDDEVDMHPIPKDEEPETSVDAFLDDEPTPEVEEPEDLGNEAFVLPGDIDALVRQAKNVPLRAVLAMFDKSGAGKNKLILVREVLECFSGDPDPVTAIRAVELLRSK